MEITAKDVMKLRQMTSAGMMDCKKALIEAEGDFNKAVEIIREKGKLVAAKRADRETTEGAVLARIEGGKAVLVCLGCETDFVAATPDFKTLAGSIADAAIKAFPADAEALKAANNGATDYDKNTMYGRLAASYKFYDWLSGTLYYSYEKVDNDLGKDYTENVVGIGAKVDLY